MSSSSSDLSVRVALLGGRGMLGSDLAVALRRSGHDVSVYDLPEWDMRQDADLRGALQGVGAAINCAAFTNVDGAETDPDGARQVNTDAVSRLGSLAAELSIYVLHVSTDFVFDGRSLEPYSEDDPPNPVNEYGRTKLLGEEGLRRSHCRSCIVRVQWTYGAHGTNFVEKVIQRARRTPVLKMVADQIGGATWTRDAADALVDVLKVRATGLLHYAADGYASRYDVAQAVLQEAGVACELAPCRTSEFAAPAERPLNSRFNCARFDRLIGRARPPWRASLRSFIQTEGLADGPNP